MAILRKNIQLHKIISTMKSRKSRFNSFTQTGMQLCTIHERPEILPENEILELCARLFQDMEDAKPEVELNWLLNRVAFFTGNRLDMQEEFRKIIPKIYKKYKKQNKFVSHIRSLIYTYLQSNSNRIRQYLP